MSSSASPSSSPIAGLRVPEPPDFKLPLPLRYVRPVKQAVGDAYKAAYVMGAADGYSIGQTVGYAAGHVAGVIEGGSLTAVAFGLILFASMQLRGKR